MKTIFIFTISTLVMFSSCKQQLESRLSANIIESEAIVLSGEYMGQTLPYSIPRVFGPDIISNGLVNRDITFAPEGDEIYFTLATTNYSYATVLYTKIINGIWSDPVNMGSTVNKDLGRGWSASLSPDGKYLFFMSSRGLVKKSQPKSLTYSFLEQLQSEPQNGNADIYWVQADFIKELELKTNIEH